MIFITAVSGSGKSVLLRLAIALEHPDIGQVLIEGSDVGSWSEVELLKLRGSRMGMVFQEDSHRLVSLRQCRLSVLVVPKALRPSCA